MLYSVLFSSGDSSFDHDWEYIAVDEILLDKIVVNYLKGVHEFKYEGKTYKIASYYFQIYQLDQKYGNDSSVAEAAFWEISKMHYNRELPEEIFRETGANITGQILKGRNWGDLRDDLYNVYLNIDGRKKVKTTVEKKELLKFVENWEQGDASGWLEGTEIKLVNPTAFKVYSVNIKHRQESRGATKSFLDNQVRLLHRGEWTTSVLNQYGEDITPEFKIGPYGSKKRLENNTPQNKKWSAQKLDGRIFVSHSSKDKTIVNDFVNEILILCLGADSAKIFCTSIEGLGISSGQDFRARIKDELEQAQIVIQIISQDYKGSEVCLNEMGAAWVLAERVIPLVIDGGYDVGFIHNTTHQRDLKNKKDVLQFIDDLEDLFPEKAKSAKIDGHVEKFLKTVNEKPS